MESSLHRRANLMKGDYYAYVEKIKYNMSRPDIFYHICTPNIPFVALHAILHDRPRDSRRCKSLRHKSDVTLCCKIKVLINI